jgi:aminomethyltransferase
MLEPAADYRDVDAEHRALREACGLFVPSRIRGLEMTGEDRARFLGGLVTCEVKSLAPGAGAYGFLTQVKGRVLADVTVLALPDRLWLALPASEADVIAEHLGKYVIVDRVEIRPLAGLLPLALIGPGAAAALAGVELPETLYGHGEADVHGVRTRVVREADLGTPAWTLWAPEDEAAALAERLREHGVRRVGGRAWDRLRVEAGRPLFGQDFGPDHFPQETGLEAEAVSYSKGCYLGQEVVARIHYRGGVNRLLRGLRFEGFDDEAAPLGQEIVHEGREAGTVTSAVRSPSLGHVGLAVVHKRVEPGTRVAVGAGGAEVVALPF